VSKLVENRREGERGNSRQPKIFSKKAVQGQSSLYRLMLALSEQGRAPELVGESVGIENQKGTDSRSNNQVLCTQKRPKEENGGALVPLRGLWKKKKWESGAEMVQKKGDWDASKTADRGKKVLLALLRLGRTPMKGKSEEKKRETLLEPRRGTRRKGKFQKRTRWKKKKKKCGSLYKKEGNMRFHGGKNKSKRAARGQFASNQKKDRSPRGHRSGEKGWVSRGK